MRKGQKQQQARTAAKRSNANVKYTRDELSFLLPVYLMIRDVLEGEVAIKGLIGSPTGFSISDPAINNGGGAGFDNFTGFMLTRARRYLPMPNAEDQSGENIARYRAYVQRAVFYNATARTLEGMVGQIYLIDPVMKLPSLLDMLKTDADGQGLNIIQLSKRAVRYTMAHGRSGILCDYPATDNPTTRKDLIDGEIQPVMTIYAPWNIINWRTTKRGAKTVLALVVLRETNCEIADDGFQVSNDEIYRVLRLDDAGEYTVQTYRSQDAGRGFDTEDEITPVDSAGKAFREIPFTFIGSENNDDAVDKPPLADLAFLNIGHYRNSADYEESSFMVGQPTVAATGLSEDWVKNVLHGVIQMGSRGGIPLPVGAQVQLIQANPNTLPKEAMEHKERQMVALGAKLVQQMKATRTATESRTETATETCTLASVARNVSQAIVFALKYAARFVGAAPEEVSFELNTSFELNRMTADDVAKLVATWQSAALAFEEMRDGLRKAGYTTLDDKAARTAIENEVKLRALGAPIAGSKVGAQQASEPNPNSNPTGHSNNPAASGT